MPESEDADRVKIAVEAYVYGYPLVYNLDELIKFPAGSSTVLPGQVVPYNVFGLARDLLNPDAKFVTPNNDTLYMIVAADVASGPLVFSVPETHDRYYGCSSSTHGRTTSPTLGAGRLARKRASSS